MNIQVCASLLVRCNKENLQKTHTSAIWQIISQVPNGQLAEFGMEELCVDDTTEIFVTKTGQDSYTFKEVIRQ